MKNKRFLLFTILFCAGFLCMQAQPLKLSWAKQMGGDNEEGIFAMELDQAGNIYTAGWFEGVADFDPGPNVYNPTSYGSRDIVICKYDAMGSLVWARSIGGPNYEHIMEMALDASGNIFATGFFRGTVDFDPGPGTYHLTSAPNDTADSFVCKLDPKGNLLWAKQFGKAFISGAVNITVNKSGSSYITGEFQGIADFDPGTNAHLLKAGGSKDGFILKLDADGNFEWVKQIQGTGTSQSVGTCLELDTGGNLLVGGAFGGTADLDPGPPVSSVTSQGYREIFLLKLDTTGNLLWAKHFGGMHLAALRISKSGNMYLSATFSGNSVDVDPGPNVYHLPYKAGMDDFYLLKLDKEGNFRWCDAIGGDSFDASESIDFDSLENVYLSGRFIKAVDFDPGPGTHMLFTPASEYNTFLMQTDSSGKFIWASQIKGKWNYASDIRVNRASEVVMAGVFQHPTDMDPGPDSLIFDTDNSDAYLLKLVYDPSIGIEELLPKQITCFPNPFKNELTLNVEEMKNVRLHFFNVMGQELILPMEKNGDKIRVNTTSLVPGIYFLQVHHAGGIACSKVVKQ